MATTTANRKIELVGIRGNTFPVKERLKALGGRWDPDQRTWFVPIEHAEDARELVRLADASKKQSSVASQPRGPTKVCWECGRSFTYRECKERDGDWQDSYCGC